MNWEQRSVDKEAGSGDQGVYRARIPDSITFEVDLLEIQWVMGKRWGIPR
jgi:hypothetical protein